MRNDELTNKRYIIARTGSSFRLLKNWPEALKANARGSDIFWTVNGFPPGVITYTTKNKSVENVSEIYSWAFELDDGTIEEQKKRIEAFSVEPSLIIRSKNGFHVYWNAKGGDVDKYKFITVPFCKRLKGDIRTTQAAQILRAPFHHHWKDKNDPFYCTIEYESGAIYSQEKMLSAARAISKDEPKRKTQYKAENQIPILEKLSGHSELNGDIITFHKNSNGNLNILVNGKSTEAFVDPSGMIGSALGGGPTAVQWVMYYGHTRQKAKEIINELK